MPQKIEITISKCSSGSNCPIGSYCTETSQCASGNCCAWTTTDNYTLIN